MAPLKFQIFVILASLFANNCQELIVETSETNSPQPAIITEDVPTPEEAADTPTENATSIQQSEPVAETNQTSPKNESSHISCVTRTLEPDENNTLVLINGTTLLQILTPPVNRTNASAGDCVIVTFFSPYCVFSARTAPYVNAIPAAFSSIRFFAVDVVKSNQLNMRYGLVAVPSILLFHNGRAIAKFNDTHPSIEGLAAFINKHTRLAPEREVDPLPGGPIPDVALKSIDWVLLAAWVFTILCFLCTFLKSSYWKKISTSVQTAWREAQHEHED
ncbi:thioredoxin domain-containing protein 15-like [Ornithodoros turicata]|uniref:thioredoxin domain-containing protein 15-like n=1 Tax=Ornithodoros turicata TaxID=34597 RepID=UPI0031398E67